MAAALPAPDVAIDLLVASQRAKPLGEIDATPLANLAHRHWCPVCRREYLHSERACAEPYERVAVGCLAITPSRRPR